MFRLFQKNPFTIPTDTNCFRGVTTIVSSENCYNFVKGDLGLILNFYFDYSEFISFSSGYFETPQFYS